MRLRTLIAIAVTMCALPVIAGELPLAPAPREASKPKAYKLKSVSAQVVASAIAKHFEGKQLEGRVTFDVANNTVYVSGGTDVQRQIDDIVAALDKAREKGSRVHYLRNVAAEDAVRAVTAHLESKKLEASLVVNAKLNAVIVAAPAEVERLIGDLLAALDKAPSLVVFHVTVLKVPGDFAEKCGLNVGAAPNTNSWALSLRELLMLSALIRDAKGRGECEVLTRPQLCLSDNQTGSVQVGSQFPLPAADGGKIEYVPVGFACQLTPRVMPDGRLLLRTKAEITEQGAPVALTTTVPGLPFPLTQFVPSFNTQSVQTTNELKTGETLVTRVGTTLVVITPTVAAK